MYSSRKKNKKKTNKEGLPWWSSGQESACQCRRHGDTQDGSQIQEDPTCHRSTKPLHHNY